MMLCVLRMTLNEMRLATNSDATFHLQFFLAVANHGAKREKPSKSVIYRWSRKRKLFKVHQEIVTWTARDLEHFQIGDEHYIAVANHVRGKTRFFVRPSDVCVWVCAFMCDVSAGNGHTTIIDGT